MQRRQAKTVYAQDGYVVLLVEDDELDVMNVQRQVIYAQRRQVLEGEDELPRQPAPTTDPYTPEPGPGPGERRAFRLLPLAWIAVAVLAAIILYAVFT